MLADYKYYIIIIIIFNILPVQFHDVQFLNEIVPSGINRITQ